MRRSGIARGRHCGPVAQDLRQRRARLDSRPRGPRFEARQHARFYDKAIHADRREHGRKYPHGPKPEEKECLPVLVSRRMEEGHETREEGDRADGPQGPLEPFRRPDDLSARRHDTSKLERIEEPRARDQRRHEPREEQDRERDESHLQLAKVRGAEQVEHLGNQQHIDRERANRHQGGVSEPDRLRDREADVDATFPEETPMGLERATCERPGKRRDEPKPHRDQGDREEVRRDLADADPTDEEWQDAVVDAEGDSEDDDESEDVCARRAVHGRPKTEAPFAPCGPEFDRGCARGRAVLHRTARRTWPSIVRTSASPIARYPGTSGWSPSGDPRSRFRLAGSATAACVSQNGIPRTFVTDSIHAFSVRMSPEARVVAVS